jgi:hypothetical protein
VGHGQESRAGSSLATCAVRAKPAGGIFVNPADRPEGPGGQSCAVAAPTRRQLLAGRPAADGSHRKCRQLIPRERERVGTRPCREGDPGTYILSAALGCYLQGRTCRVNTSRPWAPCGQRSPG